MPEKCKCTRRYHAEHAWCWARKLAKKNRYPLANYTICVHAMELKMHCASSTQSSSHIGHTRSPLRRTVTHGRLLKTAAVHLDITTFISHITTLGLEPIVLPCSSMNCGDITYRSTLDPVLRMEQRGVTLQGAMLIALSTAYLFSKPGVLSGLVDTYIAAPLQRSQTKVYDREDLIMGKKIATGGFGTVYQADLVDPETGERTPVVVKKATEFGEAETWMNERIMRASPSSAATFITAFSDTASQSSSASSWPGASSGPLWLVWKYEGSSTLADLMKGGGRRDIFDVLEGELFDRPLNIEDGPARRAAVLRLVARQLLEALRDCHAAGVVHRDIKPQNCIVSVADKRVKLIDFGAAADLRIGINYVPNQYLLDPRYAPPEQYIMSSQTPRAPPAPLAALLSPVLWTLNVPDRFDMWALGVTLLQVALPPLRSDSGLAAFNKALIDKHGGDLKAWRKAFESTPSSNRKEWIDGFATLDQDFSGTGTGTAWDLVTSLVRPVPRDRSSAAAALAHPWFDPSPLEKAAIVAGRALQDVGGGLTSVGEDDGWLVSRVDRSFDEGGLTEAQLADQLDSGDGYNPPLANRRGSATVAWWQKRQADLSGRRARKRLGSAKKTVKESVEQGLVGFGLRFAFGDDGGKKEERAQSEKKKRKKKNLNFLSRQ